MVYMFLLLGRLHQKQVHVQCAMVVEDSVPRLEEEGTGYSSSTHEKNTLISKRRQQLWRNTKGHKHTQEGTKKRDQGPTRAGDNPGGDPYLKLYYILRVSRLHAPSQLHLACMHGTLVINTKTKRNQSPGYGGRTSRTSFPQPPI